MINDSDEENWPKSPCDPILSDEALESESINETLPSSVVTFRSSSTTNDKSISFVSTVVSPPVRQKQRDAFKESFSVDNRARTPIFPFPKNQSGNEQGNDDEHTRLRGILPTQYHMPITDKNGIQTTIQPMPCSPPIQFTDLSNVSNSPFDDNLSTQSHLFGECISVASSSHPRATFISFRSSISNFTAEPVEQDPSQWDDIELGETSPLRTRNEIRTSNTTAARRLSHFLASHPRISVLLNQTNGVILDVAHTASREMEYLAQLAMNRISKWFPLTVLQSELSFLQQVHRLKMEQLKSQDQLTDDDYYDFGLILNSQQVYAFWADLLDFRAEYLGDASVENLFSVNDIQEENVSPANSANQQSSSSTPTSGTQCSSSGSDENHHLTEREDVAQPLVTSPMTGIRRRKGNDSNALRGRLSSYDSASGDKTQPANLSRMYSPAVLSTTGSYAFRPTSKRQSLFERAVGPFSPVRTSSKSRLMVCDDEESYYNDIAATPLRSTMNTPSFSNSAQQRRRWGNNALHGMATSTVNLMSPPVYELQRTQSMRPRRPTLSTPPCSAQTIISTSSALSNNEPQQPLDENERRRQQRRSLRIEDIPTQVIPRGIAARTHGLLPFLSALKRGIVVRKHRPNVDAVFCKLLTKDGGDTIE
jgi:hypothetical protein